MSWVVIDKRTNKAILEFFDKKNIGIFNKEKFIVLHIKEYLEGLNK